MLQFLPKRILSRSAKSIVNPYRVMGQLNIEEGSTVLEMGSPVGYFATALIRQVGGNGHVIVAGPNEESLEKLATECANYPTMSVTTLAKVLSHDAAASQSVDVAILTNLFSSSSNPDTFCMGLNHYLKSDGRVIVIDWDPETNAGPDKTLRTSKEDAVKVLLGCGLKFERALQIPGYHYGLVFTMKENH